MIYIRSFVFLILQIFITLIYASLTVLTFPFHPLTRYRFISGWAFIIMWLLRVLCNIRTEVRGVENIQKEPCIVMCKHQSAWETIALQTVFPPQVWVLKRELLWLPFFGWGLAMASPIAINRSEGREAVKQLLRQGKQRMEAGFSVVIFPEGTRIPYGKRGKYKIGGSLLAASSGAPIVPVAHNAGRLWGRNSFLKYPGVVTLSIGAPIYPANLKADEINQRVESWIENEIQQLPH
jgi:1-acyl-sn-glycerol-3-phosphate acyltransferase